MERWRQYFKELSETRTNIPEEQENHIEEIDEKDSIKEEEIYEAIEKSSLTFLWVALGRDNVTPEMIKCMREEGIRIVDRSMV